MIANNIVAPIEANKAKSQVQGHDTKTEALRYICNVSQLIDQFSSELPFKELTILSKLIADKNRTIYVVGPASSHALAVHFSTQLKYSRTNVVLLPLDTRELAGALLGIQEHDLLITFSYYRFNPVVLDIIKYFNSKRAHVTVVTNTYSNPYGIYSDMLFVLPSNVDSIVHSRTIGFLFVELLLFLLQRASHNDNNFEELENLFKHFGAFLPF